MKMSRVVINTRPEYAVVNRTTLNLVENELVIHWYLIQFFLTIFLKNNCVIKRTRPNEMWVGHFHYKYIRIYIILRQNCIYTWNSVYRLYVLFNFVARGAYGYDRVIVTSLNPCPSYVFQSRDGLNLKKRIRMFENGGIRLQYFPLSIFNRRPVNRNGTPDRVLWIGSSPENFRTSENEAFVPQVHFDDFVLLTRNQIYL